MIADWSDAYANSRYIAGAADFPPRWSAAAAAFRSKMAGRGKARLDLRYGPRERNAVDLFLPEGTPCGLAVIVHGGYWMAFDKSSWSHLAEGATDLGWAVAVPSYTLAPQARIAQITAEIGSAIGFAAGLIGGPIRLAGHSAGGHLVTRMACRGAPVNNAVQARIDHVLSISGLHDLRPLLNTGMNATLQIGNDEAAAESAALLTPVAGTRLTAWVGAAERPEFIRQNDLLVKIWNGIGATARSIHDPGHHHFSVIDGLQRRDSAITSAFTGLDGLTRSPVTIQSWKERAPRSSGDELG